MGLRILQNRDNLEKKQKNKQLLFLPLLNNLYCHSSIDSMSSEVQNLARERDCCQESFPLSQCQCLRPVILAAWEAEIGRIMFQGQPG
jgi:hypothetical protein